MSLAKRIIPKLDIKGTDLVKGVNLEGLRVLGKPEKFAKYYYDQGADELIFQDVVASLYGRNSLYDIIKKTADEIFIPLIVGGGIRSVEDIKKILRAGADKVSINTAAHENPNLISEAANIFGASTIVICIEAIKQNDGQYFAFTENGRNITGKEINKWSRYMEELGAGEILLVFVDKDGTGQGMDLDMVNQINSSVSIPVVVNGGIGNIKQILDTFTLSDISGLAISSVLHYEYVLNNSSDIKNTEGNSNFLSNKRSIMNIDSINLKQIKNAVKSKISNIRDL